MCAIVSNPPGKPANGLALIKPPYGRISYILKFDTYPAGSGELPAQTDALQQIRFEAS